MRKCSQRCFYILCMPGDTHVVSVHVHSGLIRRLLLMLSGDVESNPGPGRYLFGKYYSLAYAEMDIRYLE